MIPRTIDLTERMDFAGGNLVTVRDLSRLVDPESEMMTNDEYDAYVRWTGIFGERRHRNMKREIFDHWGTPFDEEDPGICLRCGKPMPIPWKRQWHGICRECDEAINLNSIPWKPQQRQATRNSAEEIFDLR